MILKIPQIFFGVATFLACSTLAISAPSGPGRHETSDFDGRFLISLD